MSKWGGILITLCLLAGLSEAAQKGNRVVLEQADEGKMLEIHNEWVTFANGNAVFSTETGRMFCDSAKYVKDKYINLKGHVFVDDAEFQLKADSVYYDIISGEATARGSRVELWSYADSLFGVGVHAFYNRETKTFEMEDRPVIYLKYPDTSQMIEIIADFVQYRKEQSRAEASGNTIITSQNFSTEGPCAIMLMEENTLDLYENSVVRRKQSEITGEFISVKFDGEYFEHVDVIDSAYGEFFESIDSAGVYSDRSILSGRIISLNFIDGQMDNVLCYDQAYSWYYPSMRGGRMYNENSVSGDTIRFQIEENKLQSVKVTGGVVGVYLTGKLRDTTDVEISDSLLSNQMLDSLSDSTQKEVSEQTEATDSSSVPDSVLALEELSEEMADSMVSNQEQPSDSADSIYIPDVVSPSDTLPMAYIDSVEYSGKFVEYSLVDSIIYLLHECEVRSENMSLVANDVRFNTHKRLVKAYSAEEVPLELDSVETEELPSLAKELQPATIPVILRDGDDELYGDFLEYSTETEKGRIIQSKSEYEEGIYYGKKLFREKKNIFYVDDGYYTTCDAKEPHYHFKSSRMKLIEGEKMICRPVVFYLGRVPLLYFPYYVFPLKKGRHSGFLPFRIGNFERGDRYINDVGYYWAISDYWDWLGALDYHEKNRTITIKNRINFAKRYVLDGYLNVEYRRKSSYNSGLANEQQQRSYSIQGAYNHKITPSFEIKANGSYVSSSSYYTEYSNNLDERLNREIRSKANFSKQFGKSISLSGSFRHIVNLDSKTRTDQIPNMSLSLPPIWIFGSGSKDENGQNVQKWYNRFIFRYGPSLNNFSNRVTLDSKSYVKQIDDGEGGLKDTTITETVSYRSRKKYSKINHNPSLSLPTIKPFKYINIVPNFHYSETWIKIWDTDQSREDSIDASNVYRTYSYGGGVSMNTNLYGKIYPNIGNLIGLRHVLSPSVGWGWSPDIQKHPEIRSFAGGGASSGKSSSMNIGLKNVFQAKVKKGEGEANLDLLSINSSFSYNFEAEDKPLSNMSTSFNTSSVPGITLRGNLVHTFYDTETNEEKLFSPTLLSSKFSVNFNLTGKTFLFDDAAGVIPHGEDSSSQVASSGGKHGWNLSVAYSFRESGLNDPNTSYSKSNLVSITLGFNLTPKTTVSYSQQYDFERDLTVNNRVSIVRKLHCWAGSLYWVPIGSNRGFGFKLNVIDIPDIKIDSNHDTFKTSSFNRF